VRWSESGCEVRFLCWVGAAALNDTLRVSARPACDQRDSSCPKPLRLDGDHSAINHRFSASDKLLSSEARKNHSLGDFIGLTHSPERDLCRHLRSELCDHPFPKGFKVDTI
jgi:hypothetical protein